MACTEEMLVTMWPCTVVQEYRARSQQAGHDDRVENVPYILIAIEITTNNLSYLCLQPREGYFHIIIDPQP